MENNEVLTNLNELLENVEEKKKKCKAYGMLYAVFLMI